MECSICLEELDDKSITLNCGHNFHKKCINEWCKIKPQCPLCLRLLVTKFYIHRYNYIFFKKFYVLDIGNTLIKIYSIKNQKKIIFNPCFKLECTNNIFMDDILKKNQQIDKIVKIININTLKQIALQKNSTKMIITYEHINRQNFIFHYKQSKKYLLFNILKKKMLDISNR